LCFRDRNFEASAKYFESNKKVYLSEMTFSHYISKISKFNDQNEIKQEGNGLVTEFHGGADSMNRRKKIKKVSNSNNLRPYE
jgi:hypothetical protein